MKQSVKTGIAFGLTSAIITNLGLIVGLSAGTHSKLIVLGGIFTIAIADSFSDALGIHVSEESDKRNTPKEVWESTIATFCCKFFFALLFVIPLLLLELSTAITVSIILGLFLLSVLSYWVAKKRKSKPWKVVLEHLFIAILVIIATNFVGNWVAVTFV